MESQSPREGQESGTNNAKPAPSPPASAPSGQPAFVVRIRGVPFNTTTREISSFLVGIPLVRGLSSIVLATLPDGRPTGDALIQLPSAAAQDAALRLHNEKLGSKYVQVFAATDKDFVSAGGTLGVPAGAPVMVPLMPSVFATSSSQDASSSRTSEPMLGGSSSSTVSMLQQLSLDNAGLGPAVGPSRGPRAPQQPAYLMPQEGPVVELRGLPYSATVDEIIAFFEGFNLTHDDIKVPLRTDVRTGVAVNTGYATVTFKSTQDAAKARQLKHCGAMGSRYVECLPPTYRTGRRGMHSEMPAESGSWEMAQSSPGVTSLSRGSSGSLPGYVQAGLGGTHTYAGSPMQGYVLMGSHMGMGQHWMPTPPGYAVPPGYHYPPGRMPVRPGMPYMQEPTSGAQPPKSYYNPHNYPPMAVDCAASARPAGMYGYPHNMTYYAPCMPGSQQGPSQHMPRVAETQAWPESSRNPQGRSEGPAEILRPLQAPRPSGNGRGGMPNPVPIPATNNRNSPAGNALPVLSPSLGGPGPLRGSPGPSSAAEAALLGAADASQGPPSRKGPPRKPCPQQTRGKPAVGKVNEGQ